MVKSVYDRKTIWNPFWKVSLGYMATLLTGLMHV